LPLVIVVVLPSGALFLGVPALVASLLERADAKECQKLSKIVKNVYGKNSRDINALSDT
jgi:hypothetical protein